MFSAGLVSQTAQKDLLSTRVYTGEGVPITKLCTADTGVMGREISGVISLLAELSLTTAQPSIRPLLALTAAHLLHQGSCCPCKTYIPV